MADLDELRRKYARIDDLKYYDPSQRIWWLYLRDATERWLERNEDSEVRAAYDQIKSFPESLPNERHRWLALRAAIATLLAKGT